MQETKQKLAEQKQITSEFNIVKKHSQNILSQFNALQAKHESEKESNAQMIELYNDKCTNSEQKLLEAQNMIADLKLNLDVLKQENEKCLKEIQGI